jgi:hypothetical protein
LRRPLSEPRHDPVVLSIGIESAAKMTFQQFKAVVRRERLACLDTKFRDCRFRAAAQDEEQGDRKLSMAHEDPHIGNKPSSNAASAITRDAPYRNGKVKR